MLFVIWYVKFEWCFTQMASLKNLNCFYLTDIFRWSKISPSLKNTKYKMLLSFFDKYFLVLLHFFLFLHKIFHFLSIMTSLFYLSFKKWWFQHIAKKCFALLKVYWKLYKYPNNCEDSQQLNHVACSNVYSI